MASLARVRVGWTGPCVTGPGVSTFYSTGDGATLNAAARTFFQAMGGSFPHLSLTWTFEAAGDVIDSATGQIVSEWTGTKPVDVTASSSTPNFLKGVGARLVWNTGVRQRGRNVRGSTFLVPLNVTAFQSDGTILEANRTAWLTVGAAFIAGAGGLCVWSKPTTPGGTNGGASLVTDCSAPDKVSWLSSRRD